MRFVQINVGIAVAYFALGQLGLLLALPPGYATAIWPPAGLACGACLIWGGRRVWPGIFVGSAIANSLISGHFAPGLLAVVIALGSTVQSMVGAQFLRRIDPDCGFDSAGRVARFSGAVALTSLIAATIGHAGLLSVGAIARGQLLQSFVTWWAGDALGMQIFTPLTLLLLDRREVWRGRRIPVGAALLLAFVLCGLVYGYVRNQEEEQLQSNFQDEAERLLEPLRDIDDLQIQNLGSLVAFFYASNEVLPQEFKLFAGRMIQERRGFAALEWAPLVNQGGEAEYERLTKHLVGHPLPIVSLAGSAKGGPSSAPRVPVTYIEPLSGNESALGLDLNSEAVRQDVIGRAMQSQHAVISSRIVLKQDPGGPGGLLMVQALRDATGKVTGFCIGILNLRHLIAEFSRDPALKWQLLDQSAGGAALIVNGSIAEAPGTALVTLDRGGLYYRSELSVADRRWRLALYKPLSSLTAARFSASLLILFFAFASCGALGNLALTTSGERRRIADEVAQKTRALSTEAEQRQRLDRDLRASEQRYRRALDVAQLGYWSFDPFTRQIELDRWSRLHYGVNQASIDADLLVSMLHPEDRESAIRRMRDHLDPVSGGAAVERFEVRIRGPRDVMRVLEVTAQPEFEGEGMGRRVRVVTGTSRDITDRRQFEEMQRLAREAAENAVRTRAEFVANMSHELRTPMNGILGMVALALGTRLSLQQREYLLLVQESAQSLLRLLNDILDFSKMDAGKLELEPAEFDVREQFGSTLQRLADAAHGKGLGLHLRVAATVPRFLRGDPHRLMQVLINLVSNATKFTSSGEVAVTVECEAGPEGRIELQVAVRDTGAGISRAAQQRIFEPFLQADSSITRRFGGTGLGLSICRQIIELFQGRMWLESEPGRGSTFHFTAWLDSATGPGSMVSPDRARLRGRSVLVVSDSETAGTILEELLRDWQMKPVQCGEPEQVVDAAAAMAGAGGEPPAFLVDIHAGGVFAGEELARRVRKRCGPAIRIIAMLTAAEPPDVAIRCYQAGIDATVQQPIREAELAEALVPPAAETEDAAIAHAAATALPPASKPLKILVAEDYPVNQKIALALLESRGHEVMLAENGRQAVELFQRHAFDLILMDVQMPEMDGLAATRRIRELEAGTGRHIRIVAVTASAHTGERERLLAAGMDDYLAKPYSLPGLVAVVESDAGAHRTPPEGAPAIGDAKPRRPVFDHAEALARCMNNASLLARVVASFISTQGEIRHSLHEAILRDDRDAIEHWAHRLKGGAATLSATASAEAAAALEVAARVADNPTVTSLMARIDDEVDRLLPLLDAL